MSRNLAPRCADRRPFAWWVVSLEAQGTVMTVEGELDFASSGRFAADLAALGADATQVIVDMAGVGFIDATAVGAMLSVRQLFATWGVTLSVRAPSRQVRRVFGLCEIDHLIGPPDVGTAAVELAG